MNQKVNEETDPRHSAVVVPEDKILDTARKAFRNSVGFQVGFILHSGLEPTTAINHICRAADNFVDAAIRVNTITRPNHAVDMAWKIAQVLCEFCGEEGYNLTYHHNEWRHYRLRDMHVEYCKAKLVFHLCPDAATQAPASPEARTSQLVTGAGVVLNNTESVSVETTPKEK